MALCDASIGTAFPATADGFTIIDQGIYPSYDSSGRGSLVVSNPAMSVPINGGTSLPAIAGLMSLQTWGDFAVVLGTDQLAKVDMLVVRLSDGRLWTIHPRPGNTYTKLLAVTPTEVLFGEIDDRATRR